LRFRSPSPDATRAAGRLLAGAVDERGALVALIGPLGAGKTLFVKGLAEGLGLDPARVASPTFVIASEYVAPEGRRLAHVDLYRLQSEAELEAVGFLDLLAPGAIVAVEWGDRLPGALPEDRLEVEIARDAGGDERLVVASTRGPLAEATLARWRAVLEGEVGRAAALHLES
jgi:tRNA threonylcarbamoyladenosine biosynthesis protein TsaE